MPQQPPDEAAHLIAGILDLAIMLGAALVSHRVISREELTALALRTAHHQRQNSAPPTRQIGVDLFLQHLERTTQPQLVKRNGTP
jgi:hypothetical protein